MPKDDFVKIVNLLESGKFPELKSFLDELDIKFKNNKKEQFKIVIIRSNHNILLGEYQYALEIINWVIEQNKFSQESIIYLDAILTRGEALYFLGKYNELYRDLKFSEKLLTSLSNNQDQLITQYAKLEQLKGRYFTAKGSFDEVLDHLFQAQSLYKKIKSQFNLAIVQNLIAGAYWKKGEIAKASEFLSLAVEIFTNLKNKKMSAVTLNNLGILRNETGDYDISIQNFKIARQISVEIGDIQNVAKSLTNLGNTYLLIGELEQAQKTFLESLSINKKMGNKYDIAGNFTNLGDLSRARGNFKKAIEFYQKSITIFDFLNVGPAHFDALLGLIVSCIDFNKTSKIRTYLNELENLPQKYSSNKLDYYYKIAKAYYLKHSKSNGDIADARNLFKEIFEDSNVEFEKKTFAIINYCEIILKNWEPSNQHDNLDEVKKLTLILIENAKNAFSFLVLAQSYLILANIAIIEGNINKSLEFLLKAKTISENKNLNLQNKIKTIYSKITDSQKISKLSILAINDLKQELSNMVLTRR